jgi:ABC-type multidrug transport system fused ATPase/permease subunit
MLKLIRLISFFLKNINSKKRVNLLLLCVGIIASSFLEFLTIGVLFPLFSSLLLESSNILDNSFFKNTETYLFGWGSQILNVVYIFAFLVILSTAFRLFVLKKINDLSAEISTDIASQIFEKTLYQPYSAIIKQSSNQLISGITEKMTLVHTFIFYLLNLISGFFLTMAILIALFTRNAELTVKIIFFFSFLYLIIYFISKKILKKNSILLARFSDQRIKNLQESLGNIKDLILDSSRKIYVDYHYNSEKKYRKASAAISFVSNAPKFFLEGLIIVLIIFYVGVNFIENNKTENFDLLISMGVIAFAGQRLFPVIQSMYSAVTNLAGSYYSLLDLNMILLKTQDKNHPISNHNPFQFKKSFKFINVSFNYDGYENKIFNNLNISFDFGLKIGIIGKTASGKSTFVDLFLGLLKPKSGKIFIDENELNEINIADWQKNISHVPQNIFLLNESIKKNITFNESTDIDMARLIESCKMANIYEFITSLPGGFENVIEQNGANISGGQKQRIGIARALYKKSDILVLDEATNALDYSTELEVLKNINLKHSYQKTLIIITHRVETLKTLDLVINLDKFKQ